MSKRIRRQMRQGKPGEQHRSQPKLAQRVGFVHRVAFSTLVSWASFGKQAGWCWQ
jgi:hypothetical protein